MTTVNKLTFYTERLKFVVFIFIISILYVPTRGISFKEAWSINLELLREFDKEISSLVIKN